MNDGSFNKAKGYLVLCTDSFSKVEVLHLISILENKFNLSCALFELKKERSRAKQTKNKNQKQKNRAYRIRINKSSLPYLIDLIKISVIPSMNYKIGL
jgi:LAGLIDADG DNA endonuclease family protein